MQTGQFPFSRPKPHSNFATFGKVLEKTIVVKPIEATYFANVRFGKVFFLYFYVFWYE